MRAASKLCLAALALAEVLKIKVNLELMQTEQLVANMNESLYLRLKEAVETGRWPDGQPLTSQQKEDSLTLVMLYQAKHLDQTEPFVIAKGGKLIQKTKAQLQREQEITRFNLSDSVTGNPEQTVSTHTGVTQKDA